MDKLVLIDGNSIINRAFYGIMGNKMLMTDDGTYTNAIYGFLNILFKILEDLQPKYLAVAFDLRAPTKRHEMYKEYKAKRTGMPDELASQMPILKEILQAMNIKIVEKEGYEADDILGTFAKWGEKENLSVTILTGDRDSFQLISNNISVRIPRTKMGKTETEDYIPEKILEEYGLTPLDLIEVKGLMGDSSDNIPGVAGVGEKTALNLIKEYKTIDKLYENIDKVNGKLRDKLIENKELAYLSRTLGTIDIDVPIAKNLEDIEVVEWDKEQVLEMFTKLKFSKFIDRFNLSSESVRNISADFKLEYEEIKDINNIKELIKKEKVMYYYLETKDLSIEEKTDEIIFKKIKNLSIYIDKAYYTSDISGFRDIFEDENILKCGYKQKEDHILLKQIGINPSNFMFDIEIAGYILNSNITKYSIEYLANNYLGLNIDEYLSNLGVVEST
jgi:DNA polymerase-1